MKQSASPAAALTFKRLAAELAVVVDRLVQDDVARRRTLVRDIRARVEAVDVDIDGQDDVASR